MKVKSWVWVADMVFMLEPAQEESLQRCSSSVGAYVSLCAGLRLFFFRMDGSRGSTWLSARGTPFAARTMEATTNIS